MLIKPNPNEFLIKTIKIIFWNIENNWRKKFVTSNPNAILGVN